MNINFELDTTDSEDVFSFNECENTENQETNIPTIENEYIQTEFNDELFLKHVCNYPAIYNSQTKGYSNRDKRLRAWENIAKSMGATVEVCTKRWKSLREKYLREKQKNENMYRSGAAAGSIPKWQYMSFFEYMFDKVKPRQATSSKIMAVNHESRPGTATSHNRPLQSQTVEESPTVSQVEIEATPTTASYYSQRGKKRKPEKEDAVVGVLEQIGTALQVNPATFSDKVADFCKYLAAEIRELPPSEQNEFMDETIIRLLQVKRRNKN